MEPSSLVRRRPLAADPRRAGNGTIAAPRLPTGVRRLAEESVDTQTAFFPPTTIGEGGDGAPAAVVNDEAVRRAVTTTALGAPATGDGLSRPARSGPPP